MIISNQTDLFRIIDKIKKLDLKKQWSIVIKEFKPKRSLRQNSLYWMWLHIIEYETGNDSKYLHDYFRSKYLPIIEKVYTYPERVVLSEMTSTTSLNTKEFKIFLDKIDLEIKEFGGIELPNLDDQNFERMVEYYKEII